MLVEEGSIFVELFDCSGAIRDAFARDSAAERMQRLSCTNRALHLPVETKWQRARTYAVDPPVGPITLKCIELIAKLLLRDSEKISIR